MTINQEDRAMKTGKLFSALFALLCVAMLASCQKMEQDAPPEAVVKAADSLWVLTVQATKDPDTKSADTKGMAVETGTTDKLWYFWKSTDRVKVFKDGDCIGTMNVTPDPDGGDHPTSATLKGSINANSLSEGNNDLMLVLPRDIWSYKKQSGTLASIEETCGFAIADITVTKNTDEHTLTINGTANFTNQQSIYRFAFKQDGSDDIFYIKDFILNSVNNRIVQERTYGASGWASTCGSITVTMSEATNDLIYVSLRNENTAADTYTFIATGSDDALILASKSIPASVLDVAGKFITAKKVKAKKPDFGSSTGSETISNQDQIY